MLGIDIIRIAIKREKTIKKWKKQWKVNQIIEKDPKWVDLSESWDLTRYIKEKKKKKKNTNAQ